ncbi:hypothetical protein, partial [Streptomyces niveus]|uniref:hypothetical protein n=1 Tax=Streptomyces niveus TaxID=193462 RepID=UPI00114CA8FD
MGAVGRGCGEVEEDDGSGPVRVSSSRAGAWVTLAGLGAADTMGRARGPGALSSAGVTDTHPVARTARAATAR